MRYPGLGQGRNALPGCGVLSMGDLGLIAIGALMGLAGALLYQTFSSRFPNKTGKREVAVFILALWAAVSAKYWSLSDATLIGSFTASYGLLTGSSFAFLAAVLGLQWYTKQQYPAEQAERMRPRRHPRADPSADHYNDIPPSNYGERG